MEFVLNPIVYVTAMMMKKRGKKMNADEILRRDAELREEACDSTSADPLDVEQIKRQVRGQMYLANIAPAERALIEAVRTWRDLTWKVGEPDRPRNVTAEIGVMCHAYDALLAAMEEAQR